MHLMFIRYPYCLEGMFGKSSWWLVAESWKLVAGGWKLVAVAGSL
ncbi:hypothetical protein Hanom_Chr08g00698401 [Helianthus anomalus]